MWYINVSYVQTSYAHFVDNFVDNLFANYIYTISSYMLGITLTILYC